MSNPFRPFVARPPAVAVDRFGRLIEPGHTVLISAPEGLLFEVVSVGPVLDPSLPKDQTAVRVLLQSSFPVQYVAGMPIRNLVIIGETEARQKAKAAANGTQAAQKPEPTGLVLTDPPQKPTGE